MGNFTKCTCVNVNEKPYNVYICKWDILQCICANGTFYKVYLCKWEIFILETTSLVNVHYCHYSSHHITKCNSLLTKVLK